MGARQTDLRQRREALVLRAQAQRRTVADAAARLQNRLRWAEIGFAAVRILRARPMRAVTGASLLWRAARTRPVLWISGLLAVWALLTATRCPYPHQNAKPPTGTIGQ